MATPGAQDVYDYLEGYNIDAKIVSARWINDKITKDIIPYANSICHKGFDKLTQVTELYSGNGTSILMLNRAPIVSFDALSYINTIADQFVINPQSFEVDNVQGLLKARVNFNESTWFPIFPKGTMNLRCKYTYGYTEMPDDVGEAIKYMACESVLALAGSRTGGGSLTVQSFGRQYGSLGKFTDIRKDLSRQAYGILSRYFDLVVGP
jgi:hypothetical protein